MKTNRQIKFIFCACGMVCALLVACGKSGTPKETPQEVYYDKFLKQLDDLGAEHFHSDLQHSGPIELKIRDLCLQAIAFDKTNRYYWGSLVMADTRLYIYYEIIGDKKSSEAYMDEAIKSWRDGDPAATAGKSDLELKDTIVSMIAKNDREFLPWMKEFKESPETATTAEAPTAPAQPSSPTP